MLNIKTIRVRKCLRCGHKWIPRKAGRPATCPKSDCGSPRWDEKRKEA